MHQCFKFFARKDVVSCFSSRSDNCILRTRKLHLVDTISWQEIRIKPLDVLCLRAWMTVYETHFGSHPLPGEIAIFTEDNFPFIL